MNKKNLPKKLSRNRSKKIYAAVFAFLFFTQQAVPVRAAINSPLENEILSSAQPSTSEIEEPTPQSAQAIVPATSQDFLQDELALQRVIDDAAESETIEHSAGKETSGAVALNRSEIDPDSKISLFENAVSLLEQAKDFAAQAVKSVTKGNLLYLASLPYEIGVAVVDGVILTFTSHESHLIRVTEAFKNILDSARRSFLLHFHPDQVNPSELDREGAGERIEYVAAKDANKAGELEVYAYNQNGAQSRLNADDLVAEIREWVDPNPDPDTAKKLIAEIGPVVQSELIEYRSASLTVFPGRPVLSTFASSSKFGQPEGRSQSTRPHHHSSR